MQHLIFIALGSSLRGYGSLVANCSFSFHSVWRGLSQWSTRLDQLDRRKPRPHGLGARRRVRGRPRRHGGRWGTARASLGGKWALNQVDGVEQQFRLE